jgi:serine/threonine/tyrosine protein kinase RAD53
VDWSALQRANISADGQAFIRRLLDPRPHLRMTLAAARQHPWLRGYGPIQNPQDDNYLHAAEEGSGVDHGYTDGDPVSQEFEQMQLRQNEAPNGNYVQKEGSRILRRRSHVLSQAAEDENGGGIRIMEPSWHMISNSQAQDRADNNGAGPSTRDNKRTDHPMDMSLAPMPEDKEWSAASDPPIDGCNGTRKDGKGSDDEDSAHSRSVRGTRAKKAGNSSSDEPPVKVRRSGRTPQKVPRR